MSIEAGLGIPMTPMAPDLRSAFQRSEADE
jgi:hypothetical protein